ncbi:MAG: hypothetical protein WDZ35_09775 [Crocinitomicaceae bacterium]
MIISSCVCMAQEDISLSEKDTFEYNVFQERIYFWQLEKNIKFTPFDVFNAVPTFGVDLETVMKPGLSFQYGLAYIPTFMQFIVGDDQDQFNWMRGYHVRFESRFSGFKRPGFYFSTEISMRHLIISDDVAFGVEPDGFGNFAYFIEQEMHFHRFTSKLNLKFGYQTVVGEKLVIDFYGGFSYRRNNVKGINEPIETGVQQNNFLNRYEWRLRDGHRFGYVLPILGVRIGIHQPAMANI